MKQMPMSNGLQNDAHHITASLYQTKTRPSFSGEIEDVGSDHDSRLTAHDESRKSVGYNAYRLLSVLSDSASSLP